MKIALSLLCENPFRRTGLTTAYHEFVSRSLKLYEDIEWVVFVGPDQPWNVKHARVQVVRSYPANNRLFRRLVADHLLVPRAARQLGADLMLSTGFVPLIKSLPTVMHALSLQHLAKENRVGLARRLYRSFIMSGTWTKADLVITNSKFAVQQILAVMPQLAPRLVQAYEGLQHEQFHTRADPSEEDMLRKELELTRGYFLSISNFYPYKQPRLIIEAYARLSPELRAAHPLVMVGGDWNNELGACRTRAEELGLAGNIRFPGWVPDEILAPLYRNALAFCMASREETFGRSVIEAMACGTPVLVHDIPIMHEVTDGHALIVNFSDTQSAAAAMTALAMDRDLRDRLIRDGLVRASGFTFERFTTERIDAMRSRIFGGASPAVRRNVHA